jgi:hypothetical protein
MIAGNLHLLESVLSQGFRLERLETDQDLDPIRDEPEFRRLIETARARRGEGIPRPVKSQASEWRR